MNMRRLRVSLVLSLLLLSACGKPEVEEIPEAPPLHVQQESCQWDGITFNAITPVCAFDVSDNLIVYPYYNTDRFITVRRIFISANNYWITVIKEYEDTNNIRVEKDFSLITNKDGITVCYIPVDDESAYLLESDLPSSYVIACAREICKQ